MGQTEISSLGEFGLIDRLTGGLVPKHHSTSLGVGDDAAVLEYPAETDILVTTDMLLENVHFDLTYVPLKHLGYKAAVVNFSDIYAMNGVPRQITVSLGVSKRFTVEHMEELYAGIRLACEIYGVDIIGGDTCASHQGLVISITCIGEAGRGNAVRRSGAKPTDIICVSGDLGAAYMGLQLLEREKIASAGRKDFEPDFAGKEYIVERQLKPEARRDAANKCTTFGFFCDISDFAHSWQLRNLVMSRQWNGEQKFVIFATIQCCRDKVHVKFFRHESRLIVDRYAFFIDTTPYPALFADVQQFRRQSVAYVHHGCWLNPCLSKSLHNIASRLWFELALDDILFA